MVDEIAISCKTGKAKYTVKLPPPSPTYTLTVTPDSGAIRKVCILASNQHKLFIICYYYYYDTIIIKLITEGLLLVKY
jgi:hypothetical protein